MQRLNPELPTPRKVELLRGKDLRRAIKAHPRFPHLVESIQAGTCDECGESKPWQYIEPIESWWKYCQQPQCPEQALEALVSRPRDKWVSRCYQCNQSAYRASRGL